MGRHADKFAAKLCRHKEAFELGRVLYVDPASGASSPLGWAVSEAGQLTASGTVQVNKKYNTPTRLRELAQILSDSFMDPKPDLVIVEEIRGRMAHHILQWAVGVVMISFSECEILEMPISVWKEYRWDGYEKTDENDTKCMFLATQGIIGGSDGS